MSTRKLGFLDFAAEIRTMILREAFEDPEDRIKIKLAQEATLSGPSYNILLACKTIYKENLSFYYSHCTITVGEAGLIEPKPYGLGQQIFKFQNITTFSYEDIEVIQDSPHLFPNLTRLVWNIKSHPDLVDEENREWIDANLILDDLSWSKMEDDALDALQTAPRSILGGTTTLELDDMIHMARQLRLPVMEFVLCFSVECRALPCLKKDEDEHTFLTDYEMTFPTEKSVNKNPDGYLTTLEVGEYLTWESDYLQSFGVELENDCGCKERFMEYHANTLFRYRYPPLIPQAPPMKPKCGTVQVHTITPGGTKTASDANHD